MSLALAITLVIEPMTTEFLGWFAWPATAAIAAGLGTLGLIAYLDRYRGTLGVGWFMAALTAQAVFCFAYGVGLFVFDPTLRLAFEIAAWVGLLGTGVLFLPFTLAYTGRSQFVRGWQYRSVLAVQTALALFVVTNPLHQLAFSAFEVDPVAGLATVSYAFHAPLYAGFVVAALCVLVGVLLLVDTVASYGSLYRREATAVALSTVPPTIGLVAWLLEVGPVPQLNLGAALFLPHVVLDAYAFVGTNMFDRNPTARRAAERSAIDDLLNPVVILDANGHVVECNQSACSLFDVERTRVLGSPVSAMTDTQLDTVDDDGSIAVETAGRTRTFTVSRSPLCVPGGRRVGTTVVLQDVTTERRREQRLSVLNRVLRHNLRNEMMVITGYASHIADAADSEAIREEAATIADTGEKLVDVGNKARAFETSLKTDPGESRVDLSALVRELCEEFRDEYPTMTFEHDVPDLAHLHADPRLVRLLVSNLLENAAEHNDHTEPWAEIRVTESNDSTAGYHLTVRDNGPGIPDAELSPLAESEETPLEHGSGIGLWIAQWSADVVGAELSFETDETGTTARVSFPAVRPDP